jgi:hypothetical protein
LFLKGGGPAGVVSPAFVLFVAVVERAGVIKFIGIMIKEYKLHFQLQILLILKRNRMRKVNIIFTLLISVFVNGQFTAKSEFDGYYESLKLHIKYMKLIKYDLH